MRREVSVVAEAIAMVVGVGASVVAVDDEDVMVV